MIQLNEAGLVYRDHGREVAAVAPVTLEIPAGEFVGVLGPSGSGKSSLLYLASGLKSPTSGSVSFRGQRLGEMADPESARLRLRNFGFVFQFPYLLGYLTLHENVCAGRNDADYSDQALTLLRELGLHDRAHRYPHEISGGERQRVCIARALVGNPEVIFADEPTASLDHANGYAVVELLQQLRGAGTLMMVTHDPSMLEHADRVIEMADGCVISQRSKNASSATTASVPV